MRMELTLVECRALGALVEKSLTVREQYPLTFNSLLLACNQKSSRDPVMELDTETLGRGVQGLIDKGLAERVQAPGDRVPKFRHLASSLLGDDPKLIAVITVLLLRGPQTAGELKTRTERLCEFASTAEVEGFLQELSLKPEPLVAKAPRQPGQKEGRYTHLLSPEAAAAPAVHAAAPAPAAVPGAPDRMAELEKRVADLEALVKELSSRLPPPETPAA